MRINSVHRGIATNLMFLLFVMLVSCSRSENKVDGKWSMAGFKITSGLEQLDSFQRMQLQFQLAQYQMLNVNYEFAGDRYKIFILGDSLVDEGQLHIKDSVFIFVSSKNNQSDTLKMVRLENDTIEFAPFSKSPTQQQILTVNMILARQKGNLDES